MENESDRTIEEIFAELRRAEAKHPGWPDNPIHAVAIVVEEAGEAMQAALQLTYEGGTQAHLRQELVQTGAMAIRALINFENDDRI